MSTTMSWPGWKRAAVGWACGSAERTPAATMVSNDGFSAPRRRMRYSSSAARSCSVMPGRAPGTVCGEGGLGGQARFERAEGFATHERRFVPDALDAVAGDGGHQIEFQRSLGDGDGAEDFLQIGRAHV